MNNNKQELGDHLKEASMVKDLEVLKVSMNNLDKGKVKEEILSEMFLKNSKNSFQEARQEAVLESKLNKEKAKMSW